MTMTGIGKAIHEAKVSPMSSPYFLNTSGTTKLGGVPVITPMPPMFAARAIPSSKKFR